MRIYYIKNWNERKKLTNRAAKQENRKDEQLHFDFIQPQNEGMRQFLCQSFWIDKSENCSCACLLFFDSVSPVFTRKKRGLSRLHNWKSPQSYTTSREGISRPDKLLRSITLPAVTDARQIVNWEISSRRSAHIVVHFLNSAFAILSRSDLQFLRPHSILQFLGQDKAYFRVTACRTRRTSFWAQMLCNLCNLHLSAAHLLQYLPQVPMKAARTVRPKGIF